MRAQLVYTSKLLKLQLLDTYKYSGLPWFPSILVLKRQTDYFTSPRITVELEDHHPLPPKSPNPEILESLGKPKNHPHPFRAPTPRISLPFNNSTRRTPRHPHFPRQKRGTTSPESPRRQHKRKASSRVCLGNSYSTKDLINSLIRSGRDKNRVDLKSVLRGYLKGQGLVTLAAE